MVTRAEFPAPRVTLLLLAHNQQAFVRAAARSCLAQDCEPLEIVFSDDGSTDATFAELQAAAATYVGPHRLRVRRNRVNLGIGGHYNRLIAETSGSLIITAAGDDVSMPDRVRRLVQAWDESGQRADLVASHYIEMGRDGTPGRRVATDDLAEATVASWLTRKPYTVGATHAFTRRMMERFGPFIDGICYEDNIMLLRALCTGGALTVKAPLLYYRQGGLSTAQRSYTVEQVLDWHRSRNGLRLAEVEQLLLDSRLAGCGNEVEAALAGVRAREQYRHAMLTAPGVAARLRLLLGTRGVPLPWRVRKFCALSLPRQTSALMRAYERLLGRA